MWLAVTAAVILSVPFILIYAPLGGFSPEHDISPNPRGAVGRPLACVIALIYGWYSLQVMYESVNNLGISLWLRA